MLVAAARRGGNLPDVGQRPPPRHRRFVQHQQVNRYAVQDAPNSGIGVVRNADAHRQRRLGDVNGVHIRAKQRRYGKIGAGGLPFAHHSWLQRNPANAPNPSAPIRYGIGLQARAEYDARIGSIARRRQRRIKIAGAARNQRHSRQPVGRAGPKPQRRAGAGGNALQQVTQLRHHCPPFLSSAAGGCTPCCRSKSSNSRRAARSRSKACSVAR